MPEDRAGEAVYLYAIARGLDRTGLGEVAGIAGAPVRTVAAGDLTALVSTVRLADYGEEGLRANLEDLTFLEATARAHHHVVDLAARAAPTVPVRIATIYRDDGRVARILRDEHRQFSRILDRVTGRSEWGVKAYAGEPAGEPAEPAEDEEEPAPAAGGKGAGTAYLMRRRAQRDRRRDGERRLVAQAQAIHAELADHAVASRRHRPQDPKLSGHPGTPILNMAYLLDDEQVAGFREVTRSIDERLPGVTVEVTGPWPPYSFIDTASGTPDEDR